VVPDKKKTLGKNTFVEVNLFEKYAMARVEKFIHKHLKDNKLSSETHWNVIIDPPRSGFKTLGKLTNLGALKGKVQKMAYLSCNPQSLKRDIDILMESGQWELEKLTFLDFFPSTHHLEALAFFIPKTKA
jgi:23S rRNA (uracil1939-C5)-methyltransferase